MKKYKEFRSEQQYITEVGPLLGMLTGLLGLGAAGYAGLKTAKAAKDKWKGYKETKADKKAREKDGFTMSIKTYNPETDKDELQDFFIDPEKGNDDLKKLGYELPRTLTGKIKAPSDDDLDKMEKEANRKSKRASQNIKNKIKKDEVEDDDLTSDQQTQLSNKRTKDAEDATAADTPETDDTGAGTSKEGETKDDKVERDKDGNLKNQDDAEAAYKASNFKKAPAGWQKDPDDEKKVVKRGEKKKKATGQGQEAGKKTLGVVDKDKQASLKQRLKDKKANSTKEEFLIFAKTELSPLTEEDRTEILEDLVLEEVITLTESKELQTIVKSKLLKFGEFISEDVMKDLLKATKSKKDSEITLDDGTDIPIDPLTSQILVKYIEGLSSSEKNRTIQQIQRTERAFMKVLGKAHENT